jgi:hypothetical protein
MTQEQKAQAHRIFTALLVIGVSGSGKTSLLATFADYLWETHQKILLLYSWDGGAIPTSIQKRMYQGLIRFWRARTRSAEGLALDTLYFATKGYWPRQINPRTGETNPAVDLVAPVTTKYELYGPNGQLLKTVPTASLIKPTLLPGTATMVPIEQMTIKESIARTKGFEQVGGVAFDGLTSMCSVVMEFQDRQRGLGLIGGEKSSFGGVVTSGSMKWGGNNRADVGFAQSRAEQFVMNTLSIPGLVESPVFTGLSTEGTDKGGMSVIGVDLPGQAALTAAPQWFGNIAECDTYKDEDGDDHFCLNLQKFTDAQGRVHLLKTSGSPGFVQRLIDPKKKDNRPFEQFNLGRYFTMLDQDLHTALADEMVGAPGMPDGVMEYGEPAMVEAPVAGSIQPPAGKPSPAPAPAPPAGNLGAPPKPPATPPAAPKPPVAAPPSPVAAGPRPAGSVPPPPGKPPARAPGAK